MQPTNRTEQRAPQRRVIYTATNRFDFDRTKIPPQMHYEWKRVTCGGAEDKEGQIMCDMNGWTPVPANRHPELAGRNATENQAIIRGGQMLMEIPKEFAIESKAIDKFDAQNSLETQIQRLGLQARRNGARGIKRDMAPIDAEVVE